MPDNRMTITPRAAIANALLMGRGAYPSPEDWADGILKRLAHEGFVVVPCDATDEMVRVLEGTMMTDQTTGLTPMEQAMLWEHMSGRRLPEADRQRIIAGGEFTPPGDDQPTAWPEWMSIESAPRDGRTIFGANYRMGQRGMVHFNGTEWEMVNGLTNFPMGIGFYPTHWVPLPPSPDPWASDNDR